MDIKLIIFGRILKYLIKKNMKSVFEKIWFIVILLFLLLKWLFVCLFVFICILLDIM